MLKLPDTMLVGGQNQRLISTTRHTNRTVHTKNPSAYPFLDDSSTKSAAVNERGVVKVPSSDFTVLATRTINQSQQLKQLQQNQRRQMTLKSSSQPRLKSLSTFLESLDGGNTTPSKEQIEQLQVYATNPEFVQTYLIKPAKPLRVMRQPEYIEQPKSSKSVWKSTSNMMRSKDVKSNRSGIGASSHDNLNN